MKVDELTEDDLKVIYGALGRLLSIIEMYPEWHAERSSLASIKRQQDKLKKIIWGDI